MFPETGPRARSLYPKQLQFFEATKECKETIFIAANRVGKTEAAAYAITAWLTGIYPSWWKGRVFAGPVDVWACCVTNRAIGEVLNEKLLGKPGQLGTGMIPKHLYVEEPKHMPGVPETYQSVKVRHSSGGISYISFKSYEQSRESYQGTARHVIWFDEEPPQTIYSEALTRTATLTDGSKGLIIMTFTPLKGLSDVVQRFMPGAKIPEKWEHGRAVINAGWDDIPHIDNEEKKQLMLSFTPYEIEARTKGIPQLGSGAIYPILEKEIIVSPFKILDYWPRWFAGDCGWECTAAVFFAQDPNTNVIYVYDEYKRGKVEPPVHIEGIKIRGGNWMRGVMDAADIAASDGTRYVQLYRDGGLDIQLPYKARGSVHSGIQKVWQGLCTGDIKVFSTCQQWLEEFRVYRRDEKGDIIKKNDHLMDSTRYGIVDGIHVALSKEQADMDDEEFQSVSTDSTRNPVTGY